MRKATVVEAKAHFSKLVDLAEHKGQRTVVYRHGKPAAAIVPVDVAIKADRPLMSEDEAYAFLDAMLAAATPVKDSGESIADALGRTRLDWIR